MRTLSDLIRQLQEVEQSLNGRNSVVLFDAGALTVSPDLYFVGQGIVIDERAVMNDDTVLVVLQRSAQDV